MGTRPDHDLAATRRGVLRGAGLVGLAVAGGSAFGLGGCTDEGPGSTGTTTSTLPEGPIAGDIDLAIAAVTVENSAVALYRELLEQRPLVLRSAGLVPLLERFRDHHVEHAAALNRFLLDQGLDRVPSDRFFGAAPPLEEGELDDLPVEDLLALVLEREDQLTQTYVDTLGRLVHAPLRLLVTTVVGIEARHVTSLDLEVGGIDAVLARAATQPAGRYPTDQSLLGG